MLSRISSAAVLFKRNVIAAIQTLVYQPPICFDFRSCTNQSRLHQRIYYHPPALPTPEEFFGFAVNTAQKELWDKHKMLCGPARGQTDPPDSANFQWCFIPQLTERTGVSVGVSKYGGLPFLSPSESWPNCGSCSRPLLFCFQLRMSELPGGLGWVHGLDPSLLSLDRQMFQFFFCRYDCLDDAPDDTGVYNFQLIRLVDMGSDGRSNTSIQPPVFPDVDAKGDDNDDNEDGPLTPPRERALVRWKCKHDVPDPNDPSFGLADLLDSVRDHQYLADLYKSSEIESCMREKLSGFPCDESGFHPPTCNLCDKSMRFFYQILDLHGLEFSNGGHVFIYQCAVHRKEFASCFEDC